MGHSVQNIEGSSKRWPKPTACKCESWLDHWKRNAGGYQACKAIGRTDKHDGKLNGAHVYVRGRGRDAVIVPLCDTHNQIDSSEWFEVSTEASPVPVSKQSGCRV